MARRQSPPPASDSADTESWLVEGLYRDDSERPAPAPVRKDEGPDDDPADDVSALRRDLARATVEFDRVRAELAETEVRLRTTLIDEVRAHAKALDHKQRALSDAITAFSSRLDELERRLGSLARESEGTQETLSVPAADPRHEPAEETVVKTLDLNSATFEELRGIGLSVTQAKRVLTYRDRLGGFDSVTRLREVPGLPGELLRQMQAQTHV